MAVTIDSAPSPSPLPQAWDLIAESLTDNFLRYLNSLGRLPGGPIVLRYIKSSYQNDPVRSLFELALFLFAVKYFLSLKKKENKNEVVKFLKREIDELCAEWEPEPLVEAVSSKEKWQLKAIPTIVGKNGPHVTLEDRVGTFTNLASNDFLSLNNDPNIIEAARETMSTAGVGACGPPNFYGTQDVHVRLEEDLAHYFETERAILYGQDFVTAGSVIPAFLKRGDLCVVDSGVSLAIQKALVVSRCDIEWYDHNDAEHLEKILSELKPVLDKQKPLKRRFIITESIFSSTGDLVNLPSIVELKNKFKYRLFLDETLAVGVLGATGKGAVEHFGIPRSEIAITIGSMALSMASSGGFCVGVEPMVHHQRIQSTAYVFSASLPPYAAKVASQAIIEINRTDKNGKSILVNRLQENVRYAHAAIVRALSSNKYLTVVSLPFSSLIHIALSAQYSEAMGFPLYYGNTTFLTSGKPSKKVNPFNDHYNTENFVLQLIVDDVLESAGILITRTKLLLEHENLPLTSPHLLVNVNAAVSKDELDRVARALDAASNKVCALGIDTIREKIEAY